MASDLNHLETVEINQLKKDKVDLETDLNRLQSLSSRYAELDRQMEDCTAEFEKAQDLRKQHRLKLSGIFDKVSQTLDENLANEVNFDEVEELCKMIDEKDQTLYMDLMRIKDQLNKKKIDSQGFKPDGTTVSSIKINEIEVVQADILQREKDDLDMNIAAD